MYCIAFLSQQLIAKWSDLQASEDEGNLEGQHRLLLSDHEQKGALQAHGQHIYRHTHTLGLRTTDRDTVTANGKQIKNRGNGTTDINNIINVDITNQPTKTCKIYSICPIILYVYMFSIKFDFICIVLNHRYSLKWLNIPYIYGICYICIGFKLTLFLETV